MRQRAFGASKWAKAAMPWAIAMLFSAKVFAASTAREHLDLCLQPQESSRSTAHCWYALNQDLPFASENDRAEARLRVSAVYFAKDRDHLAWPLLDPAIRVMAGSPGQKGRLSEALAIRGQILLRRWEIDAGREDLSKAAVLAREAGKTRLEMSLLLLLSRVDLGIGQPQMAAEHLQKILDLSGKPDPRLEEEFRVWLGNRGSAITAFLPAQIKLTMQILSGEMTGDLPVDEVEVDFLLHLRCKDTVLETPGFTETLCTGPTARQLVVDTLRIAQAFAAIAENVDEKLRASMEADVARFCPLLQRSDILFDVADLHELAGSPARAKSSRAEAWEAWKRTSGHFVQQNDDAMMNMARTVGAQFFPERKAPEIPAGGAAAGPLMSIHLESERPKSSASLLGKDCARDASGSPLLPGAPSDLATLPATLQNPLFAGPQSLRLPQESALKRAEEARTAAKAGDIESARGLYQEAIDLAATRTLDPAAVSVDVAARSARLFGEFVRFLAENGRSDQAFEVAERSRSLAFDNAIHANLPQARAQHAVTLSALRQLEVQIIGLRDQIQSRKAVAPPEYPAQVGDLEKALLRTTAERDERVGRLRATDPETAALFYGDSVGLAAAREILPPDTAMVAYFFTGDLALAWVVDRDSTELVRLRQSPADLEKAVKDFQSALLDRRGRDAAWKPMAGSLYEYLIRPLETKLDHGNIVLVPHGILHTLPFAALLDARDGRYAGEKWTLSGTPSASALRFLEGRVTPFDRKILAFGDPNGSLPFARKEAQAIAALFGASPFLGAEATANRLRGEAKSADIVHLAVHASREAAGGHLELAPKGPPGKFRTADILQLNLAQTNLVVLSACNTATGPIGGGDTMASLNRAFLIAGSPTVIATLWPVADDASSALMTAFYRHLLENPERGYPDALQRAQHDVRTQTQWASPYFWAGFAVTGHVGRAPAVSGKQTVESPPFPKAHVQSAPPPARPILVELFDDNRNGWYESNDPGATAEIRNGLYIFGCKTNEWRFATKTVAIPPAGDFDLRATVTKIRGVDNYFFGLIWEGNDAENFSTLAITGDGRVAVARKAAGTFQDFIDPGIERSAVRKGNARNELRILRRKGHLQFFVNDDQVYSTSAPFTFGANVGVFAFSDLLLAFEELVIEAP